MINLELDISNYKVVNNAISKLQKYPVKLEKAIEDGLIEVAQKLEERMLLELAGYGLADSNLAQTIRVEMFPDGVSLMVGSEYAVFVEYGTGFAGLETKHPKPPPNWVLAEGEHSRKGGWWYPTTPSDPNPNKWYSSGGDKPGLYAWTKKGLPARPFMYNTWRYGTRIASQIINKHIRRIKI